MSLLSILKTVGKDLSHVGLWIDEGLKIAVPVVNPIVTALDPPLAPIVLGIENVLAGITNPTALNATNLQQIITAVTTLETIAPGLLSINTSTTTSTTTSSKTGAAVSSSTNAVLPGWAATGVSPAVATILKPQS